MSEDRPTREKAPDHPLFRLLQLIPGYQGYREREQRRTADRLLRDHLVARIDEVRNKLERFTRELQTRGRFKPVADVERVARRLGRMRDRLDHAPYGYAGFLSAVQINEAELDRLYEFDWRLQEAIGQIAQAAETLVAAEEAELTAARLRLEEQIEAFSQLLDQRSELAAGLGS